MNRLFFKRVAPIHRAAFSIVAKAEARRVAAEQIKPQQREAALQRRARVYERLTAFASSAVFDDYAAELRAAVFRIEKHHWSSPGPVTPDLRRRCREDVAEATEAIRAKHAARFSAGGAPASALFEPSGRPELPVARSLRNYSATVLDSGSGEDDERGAAGVGERGEGRRAIADRRPSRGGAGASRGGAAGRR